MANWSEQSAIWGGVPFTRVTAVVPDQAADGRPQRFEPAARFRNAATARLHRYGSGPFCRFSLHALPAAAGVYVLTRDRQPVYVGECQNLAQRWSLSGYGSIQPRNCFAGGQQTNCRINNLILNAVDEGATLELWFRASDQRKSDEATLRRELRPPWNAQPHT